MVCNAYQSLWQPNQSVPRSPIVCFFSCCFHEVCFDRKYQDLCQCHCGRGPFSGIHLEIYNKYCPTRLCRFPAPSLQQQAHFGLTECCFHTAIIECPSSVVTETSTSIHLLITDRLTALYQSTSYSLLPYVARDGETSDHTP